MPSALPKHRVRFRQADLERAMRAQKKAGPDLALIVTPKGEMVFLPADKVAVESKKQPHHFDEDDDDDLRDL